MDTEAKKPRVRHADTVTLDRTYWKKSTTRFSKSLPQNAGSSFRERITWPTGYGNQPRSSHPEEVEELIGLFYDEERFLKEALKEVRSAKARGERASVDLTGLSIRERKPRKKSIVLKSNLPEESPPTEVAAPVDSIES